ncbi:MAG: LysR family transcriptional regulator [Eubacterium sp.]|nr:LysR family transcriptional regulator [Eubacterium sp.]
MALPDYTYFAAIVEAGSLTKAAENLYVSQPSLSQYLKRLETNLGVELFDHGTSPLRLTYSGERYYQHILHLMQLEKNLRREFQDIQNQESGRLRLGVALWRGACLLPDVFPFFHSQYPGIQMELYEGSSKQLESALIHDNIDLAIMNLPQSLNYDKLTCDIIIEEPILLALPTDHPRVRELTGQSAAAQSAVGQSAPGQSASAGEYVRVPLDFLEEFPVILTKPGQNLTYEVRHFLSVHHIEPDILMETSNLTTAINLVASGMACTFVPAEGARVCHNSGDVTFLPLDAEGFQWPLAAVYPKNSYLTKLSRLFIEVLRMRLTSLQYEFYQ